jgi:hypothetical protein
MELFLTTGGYMGGEGSGKVRIISKEAIEIHHAKCGRRRLLLSAQRYLAHGQRLKESIEKNQKKIESLVGKEKAEKNKIIFTTSSSLLVINPKNGGEAS